MNKYIVKLEAEEEITAENKEEAEELFFHYTVFDGNNNAESFIADNLTIKKIKKVGKKKTKLKN